ncbi:outer membrane lipoprotein-sorting protein [candidate division WOR-3 bacterium]|nr:outer membrane lipoprotein-sorting protein [candidate division WOR-3 bacterium]
MKKIIIPCIVILLLLIIIPLNAITVEEIISKRDENEYIKTAKVESEMIIVSGSRTINKSMTSYVDDKNVLTEFTNPNDRGTKFLKKGDELWMFFPEAEDVIKLSGHMLKQGMMGSDFSYQDMMESDKLTDLYTFELMGEEEIDGRQCYILEGIAVEGKEVSYYKRKAWIDKERFIGLREELYTESGRLLKEMIVTEVKMIGSRWYPFKSEMINKLRTNTKTEFIIKSIVFNPNIPSSTFTLENL